MDTITITREEFREKITNNPEGYGIVRYTRKNPEQMKSREARVLIEELTLMLVLGEIEEDLFGPEE